jgi:predicted RNA-binding protein
LGKGDAGSGSGTSREIGNMHRDDGMCLSTIYMDSGTEQVEIMKDVARLEAEGQGFWLIDLFGQKTFVEGKIQTVHLTDGHFITIRKQDVELALSL